MHFPFCLMISFPGGVRYALFIGSEGQRQVATVTYFAEATLWGRCILHTIIQFGGVWRFRRCHHTGMGYFQVNYNGQTFAVPEIFSLLLLCFIPATLQCLQDGVVFDLPLAYFAEQLVRKTCSFPWDHVMRELLEPPASEQLLKRSFKMV